MTKLEEVRIALGLDPEPVRRFDFGGLGEMMGGKLSGAFNKSFGKLMTAGIGRLFAGYSLFDLAEKGVMALSDYLGTRAGLRSNEPFNISQLVAERLGKIADTIRELRRALQATGEDLKKAEEDFALKHATNAERLEVFRLKLRETLKDISAEATSAELARREMESGTKGSEHRAFWSQKYGEHQTKMNRLMVDAIKYDDKRIETQRALNKEKERELELQQAAVDKQAKQAGAAFARSLSELDPLRPSLQQLAESGAWRGETHWGITRWRWQAGPFADRAQRIMNLQQEATQRLIWDDVKGAKRAAGQARGIYNELADLGIVPMSAEQVAQAQIDMEQHLRKVIAREVSLRVTPEMQP